MYSALMIDLRQSRKYGVDEREEIQHFIYEVLDVLNMIFRNSLERKSEFSAGDEVQGLFKTPGAAYLYYRLFSVMIHPVKIRAGIGVGTWDIRIEKGGTTAQDGQVYHRARKAISAADETEGYSVLYCSQGKSDTAINSLIGEAAEIVSRMNAYQNDLMLFSEMLSPINIGEAENVSVMYSLYYLLWRKRKIRFFAREKSISDKLPLADNAEDILKPVPVDACAPEESFFVTSGKPRGLPVRIANILGITRQSVERTLKAADIFTARNMAISAIKAMTE
ncbi:MAG: hypothetical protein IJL71_04260 [Oscillospiraceae bacterium]|nr:hypothetical protein [Oscillospiraceae bacterium]